MIPSTTPIPICYQDEHFLVVDKPADLLTVPGRGPDKQDCLINRVIKDYPNSRIVHRLDMATSGLVLLAQSHAAQVEASKLFASREMNKCYIAVVDGEFKGGEGTIEEPLICDWDRRPLQKVDYENGKYARTDYQVMGYEPEENTSRVKLHPLTGRSHQLRVHMLSCGHPIIGDRFYASEQLQAKSSRMLLHAWTLSFLHPFTQEKLTVEAPLPF